MEMRRAALKLVNEIRDMLKGYERARRVFDRIVGDEEIMRLIDHANTVAILRWGYNDHGIVHALITTRNALKMALLLHDRGVKMNCESEMEAKFEEGLIAIIAASMLHDLGNMAVREEHELISALFAYERARELIEKEKLDIRLLSYIIEGIVCHMGNIEPTSVEAKIVSVADGLDMEEGRARIPYRLRGPDIHKFSALAIKKVEIMEGNKKPVKIVIHMTESAGVFQIEGVLMKKFKKARFEEFAELYAEINGNLIRYS